MRSTLFAADLLLGFLMHLRWAYQAAVGDEGMLWLWMKAPETTGERFSRYSFYLWIASCFVAFLPIDLRVGAAIPFGVMFGHTIMLSRRHWKA
jgi:hypothetical protein